MEEEKKIKTEEFKVDGNDLIGKVKELLHEGNIRRIVIKQDDDTIVELPLTVAYDAACHLLHAQKISDSPLRMLESIPRLRLVPLRNPEECCGGAGMYGITQTELGAAIGQDKILDILDSGAEVVATANTGMFL